MNNRMPDKSRPKKRTRSETEIATRAEVLRQDWTTGDVIEAWLRRHADELTELVRNYGWSWDDIGRAMDRAGISYETGTPWSGRLLTRKVSVARQRNAANATKKAAKSSPRTFPITNPGPEMFGVLRDVLASLIGPPATQPTEPPQRKVVAQDTARAPDRSIDNQSDEVEDRPGTEFEFGLAKPLWTPPPPTTVAPVQPVPSKRRDVDEAIERLTGRPKFGSISMPTPTEPEDD